MRRVLRREDIGLEFGSGRSTTWLAWRTARLVSVETDPRWYVVVQRRLASAGLAGRVDCRLIPADEAKHPDPQRDAYIGVCEGFSPSSLDYVLIDGLYRDLCAVRAVHLVRPGGMLILDNVNRYLPSHSRSPETSGRFASPAWEHFQRLVDHWRLIWTSSGVTDTAIWFRAD
jgi:predicted O-methyltransferase YrrM